MKLIVHAFLTHSIVILKGQFLSEAIGKCVGILHIGMQEMPHTMSSTTTLLWAALI